MAFASSCIPPTAPRGLIRIYAPFLDNPPGRVINFIAIEPIIDGKRGYSELERSATDGQPGKMNWNFDEVSTDPARKPDTPAGWRYHGQRASAGAPAPRRN
jgi:hypothetical protein